jgi:hypothetical protein
VAVVDAREPCFTAKEYAILRITCEVFMLCGGWNAFGI